MSRFAWLFLLAAACASKRTAPPSQPSEPKLTLGGEGIELVTSGIVPNVIDGIVRRYSPQIEYCFQRVIDRNEPPVTGDLVVDFVIDSLGAVAKSTLHSSTLGNADVDRCVVDRFKKIRFPRPTGGAIVRVRYPVRFGP